MTADHDRLGRDIASALAIRRPPPDASLEPRLRMAASRPARWRWIVPVVAATTVAAVGIVVLALGFQQPADDVSDQTARTEHRTAPAGVPPPPAAGDLAELLAPYQALLDDPAPDSALHLDAQQRARLRELAVRLTRLRELATAQREVALIELRLELERRDADEDDAVEDDPTIATALLARVTEADAMIRKLELEARIGARAVLTEHQRALLVGPETPSVVSVRRAPPPKTPTPATLDLASDPPGVHAYVDDKRVGLTPVHIELTAGRHVLRFERAGYAAHTSSLELVDGEATQMRVTLEPLPAVAPRGTSQTGILRLLSEPRSVVYVDGRRIGETPAQMTVTAGKHHVRFLGDGGRSVTKLIVVKADDNSTIAVDLNQ